MKNSILDLLVSIDICSLLHSKGLTRTTSFEYRVYDDNKTFVCSPQFDYLGLYSIDMEPQGVRTPYRSVPAYTLAEMLSLLPEWCISKNNDKYEACTGSLYPEISAVYSKRYADAAALCVLDMINKRIIPVEQLNSLLLK